MNHLQSIEGFGNTSSQLWSRPRGPPGWVWLQVTLASACALQTSVMRDLVVLWFGSQLVRYARALRLQEQLAEARKAGAIPDTLLLLQVAHTCKLLQVVVCQG
jgi:hypothetical protein